MVWLVDWVVRWLVHGAVDRWRFLLVLKALLLFLLLLTWIDVVLLYIGGYEILLRIVICPYTHGIANMHAHTLLVGKTWMASWAWQ
jgi:hypothetical protein